MTPSIEHRQIRVNGVTLHAAVSGPRDGPLVLLLHGFPEDWRCWKGQIPRLAAAGFRVLAPDQRGYNLSDKPAGAASYGLDALADDALGLMDWAGRRTARVAGHDWGAAVAWWLALRDPSRVERLAIVNVPHPLAMRRSLARDPLQMLRSWYMLFFQLPALPELCLRLGGFLALRRALVGSSRPGTFRAEDLEELRQAWARPGALTAMLNWYRAGLRHPPRPVAGPRVKVPALVIWGARDRFLRRTLAERSLALCERGRLELLEDATHWVLREEPERVGALLESFLA